MSISLSMYMTVRAWSYLVFGVLVFVCFVFSFLLCDRNCYIIMTLVCLYLHFYDHTAYVKSVLFIEAFCNGYA